MIGSDENILDGGTDQELLLRALELASPGDAKLPWTAAHLDRIVNQCEKRTWVMVLAGAPRITDAGRRMLGILDGHLAAGRVDRTWPNPMPVRIWRRLHPRQQDAWVMKWLFDGFEFHWDGSESCRGRNGDGQWLEVPRLVEDWKPLALEDHLKRLGVLA